MRHLLPILLFLVAGLTAKAQDQGEIREGRVSFVTSQSVYVKFSSMESITEGDTLFIKRGSKFIAALQIQSQSSISCVCKPLVETGFKISDIVFARLGRGEVTESAQT